MRPIKLTLSATGNSPWTPVNRLQRAFAIGLEGSPSSGASVTWKVQHTLDRLDSDAERQIIVTRAGTVASVNDPVHGLSVGDTAFIRGSGDANLEGERTVASVVDANNYTYTVVNTGATAGASGTRGLNVRALDHATLVAQTGRADGNYAFPPSAVRLVATIVSGTVDLLIEQGMS